MTRKIKQVAVLGSGIMGSRIACHFANIGVKVILLDIVPHELSDADKKAGLTTENIIFRNRIVNDSLTTAIKSNPSPIYKKDYAALISTGNLDDDLNKIKDCDWVIEVVIENLDIKKKLYEQVEKHRKPGTLITTNTSGIPIRQLSEGRSEDFKKHFCGTHFFNPPRYLRLLEIIPGPETDKEILDFLMDYGDLFLGKVTVMCKDTPAFIANRIGVFGIMSGFHLIEKMELTVEEVDKLTGPVLGRPKSATFRTADVVGIDTLVKVAEGVKQNCPDDEKRDQFEMPGYLQKIVDNKWFGDKSNQGFYKKTKDEKGKTLILALNLKTMEYAPSAKASFATLESTKGVDNLNERIKMLFAGKDKAGEFYRASFMSLFEYVSHRIPEVSDHVYSIDAAMRAGFGWERGPFELWDILGVDTVLKMMKEAGMKPAAWVDEMIKAGAASFYKLEKGRKQYYDIAGKSHKPVPGADNFIIIENLADKTIWKDASTSLIDLGDGIVCFEWHTKMNTIGGEVIQGMHKAIDTAEKDFRGLVLGNEGPAFSAGANLALVYMYALEQEFDEINMAISAFQGLTMRVRHSSIPVVAAIHGLTLGGGCEIAMHADKVQAAAETYTGLVEFGVGLIPGGGGTKEYVMRASDELEEGGIELNILKERFLGIGMAKVSTSGYEAFDIGVLRKGVDDISINSDRLIGDAKLKALMLADEGYTQPTIRTDIKVQGRTGLGMLYAGAESMRAGHYISDHDVLISQKLGYIMCGGDLSGPSLVSENYLLDLEREVFLSLCGEKKTLERIQSILTTGKPLRN